MCSGTGDLEEEFNKEDADFHQIVADMAKIPRKQAKTINLGLFYGMGKLKLQKELNLDPQKAKTLFNTYHSKVPFVKQLSQALSHFASENGLLFTLGDRFCRFDKWVMKCELCDDSSLRRLPHYYETVMFEDVPIRKTIVLYKNMPTFKKY